MLSATLESAKVFSESISCQECRSAASELNFCGDSCKHPYCWDCIHKFMKEKSSMCKYCALPIQLNKISRANIFTNIQGLLEELQTALRDYDSSGEHVGVAETQAFFEAFTVDKVPRRTVEEVCTQMEAEGAERRDPGDISRDDRDDDEKENDIISIDSPKELPVPFPPKKAESKSKEPWMNVFHTIKEEDEEEQDVEEEKGAAMETVTEPVERSMIHDEFFKIDTMGLEDIGAPLEHSTQKDPGSSIFASQFVPRWQPSYQPPKLKPAFSAPERRHSNTAAPKTNMPLVQAARKAKSMAVAKRSLDLAPITEEFRQRGRTPPSSTATTSTRKSPRTPKPKKHFSDDEDDIKTVTSSASSSHVSRSSRKLNILPTPPLPPRSTTSSPKRKKSTGGKGEMAVVTAVTGKDTRKLKEVLEAGENPDQRFEAKTALYMAVERRRVDMAEILCDYGAVVSAHCGEDCRTPLHVACMQNDLACAELLISKGARKRVLDSHGKTPEQLAMSEEMKELMSTTRERSFVQIVVPFPVETVLYLHSDVDVASKAKAAKKYKTTSSIEEASHFVVKTENDVAEVSVPLMEAMLMGKFIVSEKWLEDGGDERGYEVQKITFDQREFVGACSTYRKNAERFIPRLWCGAYIYPFHNKFGKFSKNDIVTLIKAGDGQVLSREPPPGSTYSLPAYHAQDKPPVIVVFNPFQEVTSKIAKQEKGGFLKIMGSDLFIESILTANIKF